MIISATSYFALKHINALVKEQNQQSTQTRLTKSQQRANELQIKTTKKILSYVLVYLLQWFPTFPYTASSVFGYSGMWIYYCVVFGPSFASTMNFITLIVNEGFYDPEITVKQKLLVVDQTVRISDRNNDPSNSKGCDKVITPTINLTYPISDQQ
jgi:hypothetical protein